MNNVLPLEKLVPAYIQRFQAYIPSKPDEELKKLYGCSRLFRLNNNENPLGPPPSAREEIEGSRRPGPRFTRAATPTTCGTSWPRISVCIRTSSWSATAPTR